MIVSVIHLSQLVLLLYLSHLHAFIVNVFWPFILTLVFYKNNLIVRLFSFSKCLLLFGEKKDKELMYKMHQGDATRYKKGQDNKERSYQYDTQYPPK